MMGIVCEVKVDNINKILEQKVNHEINNIN